MLSRVPECSSAPLSLSMNSWVHHSSLIVGTQSVLIRYVTGNVNCLKLWSTADSYHFRVACLYQCMEINPHKQRMFTSKGIVMFTSFCGHFG